MSLFFKAPDFKHRQKQPLVDEFGQIPISELEKARQPMWEGTNPYDLLRNRYEHTFMENQVNRMLNADFGDWVPVVQLAKDLSVLDPNLMRRGFIVINVQHSSLADSPEALWRYSSFNLDCRCSYILDTDREFNLERSERLLRLLRLLERIEDAALIRFLQCTSGADEIKLILGNDFLVRPRKIDFEVDRMILGYIILNHLARRSHR